MLSGVSPLMKVVTSRGPHLLKPRLCHGRYKVTAAAGITSYDVAESSTTANHPANCAQGWIAKMLPFSSDAILRDFFVLHFARVNLSVHSRLIVLQSSACKAYYIAEIVRLKMIKDFRLSDIFTEISGM